MEIVKQKLKPTISNKERAKVRLLGKLRNRAKKNTKEDLKILKRHPIPFILVAVFGLGAPIFIGLDFLVGLVISNSNGAMTALIQAEATLLGFFAVFAVYGLTSIDSKIDRIDEQIGNFKLEDLKNGKVDLQNSLICKELATSILKKEEAKKRFGDISILSGILLVSSLIASITGMGFANLSDSIPYKSDYAFYLIAFSVLTFVAGSFMILSLIHDASRKPEDIYENLLPKSE